MKPLISEKSSFTPENPTAISEASLWNKEIKSLTPLEKHPQWSEATLQVDLHIFCKLEYCAAFDFVEIRALAPEKHNFPCE